MEILKYVIVAAVGYVLGSVSISIILSKLALGGDVREKGSGNAGATNMARNFGLGAGFITLGGDMLKAILAMALGWLLLGRDVGVMLGGIASMVGHCFPVFYKFKGGKGVSVLAAIAIMIDWRVTALGLLLFLLVAFATKKVSAGSITAAVSVPLFTAVFNLGTPLLILAIVAGATVIIQHRANIGRLIRGEEPDFKPAHKDK